MMVGKFLIAADDPDTAIGRATTEYASQLAECDHAFISGPHGRIVWQLDRPA
jgi:hypothetical protein